MDEKKYREYSQEFKMKALELLKRGGKSAGQLERELGITPGLLPKWRARYQIVAREGKPIQLGPSDMEAAKTEIRRLQRELANVEEEREILHLPLAPRTPRGARAVPGKKALKIFSRKNG